MRLFKIGGCVRDQIMGVAPQDIDYLVVGSTEADFLKNPPFSETFNKVGSDFPVYLDSSGNEWAFARKERSTGDGYVDFEFDTSVSREVYRGFEFKSLDNELMKKFIDGGFNPDDEYSIDDLITFFRNTIL